MKIAVIHWIVNDVGGINSWTENFMLGLSRLGHKAQLYYGSHQKRLGCHPTQKVARSRRYHLLPAKLLSYDPDLVEQSVKELNTYDLIVFAHPSPHPTKNNLQCSDPRGWQAYYTETRSPKICVFHDRHWDHTNPWIAEVRKNVDYAHAAQHHFLEVVRKFASDKHVAYGWGMFPLVLGKSLPDPSTKIRRWILATQWLALKNHRFLIPFIDQLTIPLHSYGSGQTYHKLLPVMKRLYREDHHQDEVMMYNHDSRHIHFGHTEYHKLLAAIKESWFSLDMSIQGMTNMTHWEPMTVGTISVMEERVANDRYCEIPDDCCLTFQLDNIIEELNRIAKTPKTKLLGIRNRAWEYVQKCECSLVTKKLLKSAGVL